MNEDVIFPTKLSPIQTKTFYKYKNISSNESFNYLLDSIKNKYFYFSHPIQLNDPFDANVPNSYEASDMEIQNWLFKHPRLTKLSIPDVRKKINDGSLVSVLDSLAEKDRNNFCILSLCSSDLNEILWGTYTDSYSGICLGYNAIQYDNEQIDGENVYYIESTNNNYKEFVPELRKINNKKYFFIRPVIYDNDGLHKYNIFQQDKKSIEYNIYHKKSIWKQENEFRAILNSNPFHPNVFNQKVYYGEDTLSEIIFGYRINSEKRNKIIDIVSKNYKCDSVKFYEVKPDLNTFSLKKNNVKQ